MAERKIDRAAWAELVDRLLLEEAQGNKTAFATALGVDRKTVSRWLEQEMDVREESVRAVARKLNLSPIDLLIKVGYYTADEITPPPTSIVDSPDDAVATAIGAAKVSPAVKRELRGYAKQKRADFERQLLVDVERLIAAEVRGRRAS